MTHFRLPCARKHNGIQIMRVLSKDEGFSLLELLLVMTIIILLSWVTMPALSSIMVGSDLTQSGDAVQATLSRARQTALARGHQVEVRLYCYADPETPGETPSNPSTGKYRGLQAFDIDDSGNAIPLGRMIRLTRTTIFDSGTNLSTIFSNPTNNSPSNPIPRVGTNYYYTLFHFQPDGSTDLARSGLWYLTLHSGLKGDKLAATGIGAGTTCPNYMVLQVDPFGGIVRIYRP